ncbi:hypothetical protein [Bradyrhizobium sp. CCBAU 51627]|uniref:hypothetical protein n=1 Tax=Bradyrhizobium sp. CCBAU 51627 TaxID=1325088 RepID=UPI002306895B|nr:hypothetical protein [Bradyrhizobium sp. CCBAU 51627]MDA9435743.1 hypothetical protein [Bradyrhizobium sp. CCBAU 51627]
MSTVIVFALLIGSLLGGRFRIFIVPPAIVLGATMLGLVSAWQGHGSAHILGMILVFSAALQLGYFCGALLVRARATNRRGPAAPSFDGSFG